MAYTPVLKKEALDVQPLGKIVVRMLKLSERLAMRDGDADPNTFAPRLLAISVTKPGGEPLLDVEGWDIFGSEHQAATNQILDVAMRLSGMGDEPKNG